MLVQELVSAFCEMFVKRLYSNLQLQRRLSSSSVGEQPD